MVRRCVVKVGARRENNVAAKCQRNVRRFNVSASRASRHVACLIRAPRVRDPNFLNILDVIYDKSSYFVVTEGHLGKSIAELLRERPRFDPEGALALMTPLAGSLEFYSLRWPAKLAAVRD